MKWDASIIRALLLYAWRFKLTSPGKTLICSGLIAGFFMAWSVDILTLYVFALFFALGLAALFINLAWRTRFEIRLVLPDKAVAGTTLHGAAVVRNAGRLPAYDVSVGFFGLAAGLRAVEPEIYVDALAPGEEAAFPLAIHAEMRGSRKLPPLRAYSAFPFRLLRSGASRLPMGNLLVLPAFTPADSVTAPVSPRHQPGGVSLTSNVGESPEYIGNREFRPGDSIRRLDMRAWARRGEPVVREYQEEYFLRLALVLDTYVPRSWRPRASGPSDLEAAVSLSAALVDALSRDEYLLDIFAAGPMLYNFRTGRGVSSFDSVLEILACIEACRVNPFDVVTPALADELNNISTVFFVFLDWNESRREMVRTAAESGCRTRAYVVRTAQTTLPISIGEEAAPTLLTPESVRRGELGAL